MNARILNRAGQLPADGWHQIEVTGEHLNPVAGVVQVIDVKAVDSIVNRFAAAAAEAGETFAGVLIDQEHFSLDPEKSSEAFGWLKEVRNRDGQLEGRIDWTDIGEPAVKSGRFKFFSTVYDKANVEQVGSRKIKNRAFPAVRPLALDGLALTNKPNNRGGRPISNRQPAEAETAQPTKTTMKQVNVILGLAEDAPETSAVGEIQKIKNRAAALETENGTLKTERDGLLTAQVEADLEKYKGVIKNRDQVKAQLIANRAGTLAVLESLQPATPPAGQDKITNRGSASTPSGAATESDEKAKSAEKARAAKISNRARELQRTSPGMKWGTAFEKAEAELSE